MFAEHEPFRAPVFPVEKDSSTATLDMPPLELPDHINLLYETTVAQTRLSADVDRQFKDMLNRRASTFASSFKDLGFCPLLLHDVDTGDAPPIKQFARRPLFPLAMRKMKFLTKCFRRE